MPTSAEPLLLDTSAALALVDAANTHHPAILAATRRRTLGLAGHAMWETLSVLTRLPVPHRVSGSDAQRLISTNFPATRHLDPAEMPALAAEFVAKDIIGGAVWDGLVGAVARAHDLTLLSCDRRAQPVYDVLGVDHQLH